MELIWGITIDLKEGRTGRKWVYTKIVPVSNGTRIKGKFISVVVTLQMSIRERV